MNAVVCLLNQLVSHVGDKNFQTRQQSSINSDVYNVQNPSGDRCADGAMLAK